MLKRAFTDTLLQFGYHNLRNIWRFIVPTVLALLIIRYIGGEVQMNEELRWIIATLIAVVVVFSVTFLFNLIRAPVYIKFEKEREPQLIVEQDTAVCNHKLGYSWRIKVTNKGTDTAKGCKGQLIVMVDEIPQPRMSWERWPFNESLNWSDGKEATEIRKETKELEVIYGGGYGKPLYLAYAKDEAFREQYALKLWSSSNILLVISISSDGKLPVYAVCRFLRHCDTFKHLEILAITSECPDITSYQRQDSYNGDFQT